MTGAHNKARILKDSLTAIPVTTDWVLSEVADGMAAASRRAHCIDFLDAILEDPEVRIVGSDRSLWLHGRELYSRRADKEWSLTDCISFVVMKRHKIKDALTGDHHFEQAGFNALLK
jgi:uncharacterized protein